MTETSRERLLAAVIVLLVLAGLALDTAAEEVVPPASVAPSGDRFVERASFCPPSIEGEEVEQRLAAAARSNEGSSVGLEPGSPQPVDLPAGRFLIHDTGGSPITAVGYGARLDAVSHILKSSGIEGAAAARCSGSASTDWYLPEGSSALGYDERILVFNPFPDEAVVRVTFLTPGGDRSKANLADIGVPAGDWTSISVNEFILEQPVLSAHVNAIRGRVVVWRAMVSQPDDRASGVQLSMGSPRLADTWYFPEGYVGDGYEERITVMNPTGRPAIVTVSLITGEGIVQPRRLAERTIDANSSQTYNLAEAVSDERDQLGGVSVLVQTTNDVAVAAEKSLWFDAGGIEGTSAEVGAPAAAPDWVVGPPTFSPTSDALYIVNTGAENVRVSITLLSVDGDPLTPEALTNVAVPGGLRRKIPLDPYIDGKQMVAIVRSEGELVVERSAYSTTASDATSLMGTPLN